LVTLTLFTAAFVTDVLLVTELVTGPATVAVLVTVFTVAGLG